MEVNRDIRYYLDDLDPKATAAIVYVLDHIARDYKVSFQRTDFKENADITMGEGEEDDFFIASNKLSAIIDQDLDLTELFKIQNGVPLISNKGKVDYLLSAFVLLSGIQEWISKKKDKWGRFPYEGSFQEKFGQAQVAWVDLYFENIYETLKSKINLPNVKKPPSNVVLTHDIDLLRWPIFQNGKHFLKKNLPSNSVEALHNLPTLFRNTRKNIDNILELERQFGVHSVFFWLTEKGRGKFGIKNADYSIKSPYVMKAMEHIKQSESVNALHKSSKDKALLKELEGYSQLSPINRYHFLLFDLLENGPELNRTVKQDYSYGFAEQPGFRNSYSLPFHPFDFDNWRPFQFLEVPLHIMDNTFHTYLGNSPKQANEHINEFMSRHKRGSCLSILWHNEFFTPFRYAGWGQLYEQLLKFLFVENDYNYILPEGIEKKYRIY